MKKFIVIFTAIIICGATVGCGDIEHDAETNAESYETSIQTTVETSADSTEAIVEYPEFFWPGFGTSEALPHPEWITNGVIHYDMTDAFSMSAGNVTRARYKEYTKLCYEAGFTDVVINNDSAFSAYNSDGLYIFVAYKKDGVLHIWTRNNVCDESV